ncbi:MAG: hypothetical protein Q7S17_09030 [Xanthobacteraceae bacterium]|nr:hypothetical protein [Xanthobacteraceae bacterium]
MVDLVPIDDDPFVAAAPSSGNVLDPASQPVSPWADSPIAKVGRLIGERGLGSAIPKRAAESMPDFWQRWNGMIGGLTVPAGQSAGPPPSAPVDVAAIHFVPIDHDPFAPKKTSTLGYAGDMAVPPEEGQPRVYPTPPTREPHDPMVNVERSLPLPLDRNTIHPEDVPDAQSMRQFKQQDI